MSLYLPHENRRVGITLKEKDIAISSIITAVEANDDSPFWTIYFGRKINGPNGTSMDDRGSVVIEEKFILDILQQIDSFKKGDRNE